MADPMGQGTSPETAAVSDAFVAARELLRRAEEDAARLRAEVDRYVREHESRLSGLSRREATRNLARLLA